MAKGKVIIGQSGGPTSVINRSLVGLLRAYEDKEHEGLLGARHGLVGMLGEDFVDLTELNKSDLIGIGNTPAAALGSARKKPTEEEIGRLVDIFKKNNIREFYYIGGNDSAETAELVSTGAEEIGYELQCFHIPKTIDNDLIKTDHSPGYGSAARFVAHAFQGDDADNRSLKGVKINIVMGRHAGWLTASSALGRSSEEDGPHLIYLPEKIFNVETFLDSVEEVYQKMGRCLVSVSEGIHNESGEYFLQTYAKNMSSELAGKVDSHGNVQLSGSGALGDTLADLVSRRLDGARVRADTLGYIQRSFIADVSEVDGEEAERVGAYAVEIASKQNTRGGSIVLVRNKSGEYYSETSIVDLKEVAGKTKIMPDKFLDKNKENITTSFIDYAMPLTGGIEPKTQIYV